MITLTEAAAAYIKTLLKKKGDNAVFRLSLKKTGCSGFSYAPDIVTSIKAQDKCVKTDKGFNVYLDTQYVDYLQGLTIDYREEANMGLKQKRLIFINPNEDGRCGCGESFHIEK